MGRVLVEVEVGNRDGLYQTERIGQGWQKVEIQSHNGQPANINKDP